VVGNYADLAKQFTGADPSGRVKDPLHPPAWGIVQPWIEFIQGWNGESHFSAPPSSKIWDTFANNISSQYRVGKQLLLNATNVAGLKFGPGEEYAARNNLAFLRSRLKQFENENPVFAQHRARQGTRAISIAGRGEFDPIRDRIQGALLTGHSEEARLAFSDWLKRFPPAEQPAQFKAIRQSIQSGSPIKPGGSYSLDSELAFLSWAKKNLPESEARKIFATAQIYAKTAMQTGLFDRNKTMNQVSLINYDRFKEPKAAAAVKSSPAVRHQIAEMIRRGEVAKALQAASQ
jgi:hypothetical protein